MSKWYELWGREPGGKDVILLEKFPADSVPRVDVEEEADAARRDGCTEVSIKEVDESDR